MAADVGTWLDGLGLGKYAEAFAENEIDLDALRHLDEADLKELGLPMGPRKKLLAAIAAMGRAEPATTATPRRESAERRQLTVMFVDLVGSTALSARLDPEDMREVIRRFQNTATGAIARYEGHVANFLGDGILIYFGFPRGHEDAAERAVRAGLEIVRDMAVLPPPGDAPLACRIGIATGQVVVGDLIGEGAAQERAVTGETPNLAARLQQVAGPGEVVVSQTTRDLLGNLFEVEDLGPQSLKGFGARIPAWRVAGERAVDSRFDAVHGEILSPLAGREQELALLLDRWTRAAEGDGQVVLLSGEAGIGKSRMTRALSQRLADVPHTRLRYQCSPYHVNSALHPFVAQLTRAAGLADGDDADTQRAKLEALLSVGSDAADDVLPLFAALLSIPVAPDHPALQVGPQQRMQRTQQALLDQLAGLAARQPVLLIFEDAHWADPTTLDVLGQMVDRVRGVPVLAVVTYRSEFRPPWPGQSHATALSLNRLSPRQSAAIVADLTGGKAVPAVVLDQIVEKTDGVPLFVEELTKTVLESGLLEERDDRFVLPGPLPPLAIPSTLQDSLIARLDRLVSIKELVQTGAAIGREFSHRLLAAVSPLSGTALEAAVQRLLDAELVYQRGLPPEATYVFKHALVRDAAYETLLKTQRQALHAQICDALVHQFPQVLETEPELPAHHATLAGDHTAAVDYWLRAGRKAAANSANSEAVSHLRRGLELLENLPADAARDRTELSILISLGPAQMATAGWDAEAVDRTYSRARVLARKTGQPAVLFPAVWGLWLVAHAGGAVDRASQLLEEVIDLARAGDDADLLLQAHHAGGSEMCSEGFFAKALQHIDTGIGLYRPERHADQALSYGGHDPCVCAHSLGALAQLMLGRTEPAERYSQGALDLAQRVEHRPSVAHADLYRAELCHLLRRPEEVERRAQNVVRLAEPFGLAHYAAWGAMLIGWARSARGQAEEGLTILEDGLVRLRKVGIRYHVAHRLALRVEALLAAQRIDDGIAAAEECLSVVEDTGERWFEPEALRLLALARSRPADADQDVVRSLLERSVAVAAQLQARYWHLRSATALAGVLREQGARAQARDLLAPVCAWFDESQETSDLQTARALLAELA